jgi:hypothetical protein
VYCGSGGSVSVERNDEPATALDDFVAEMLKGAVQIR